MEKKIIINPDVNETQDSILSCKDNIVVPISEDLNQDTNTLFKRILKETNHQSQLEKHSPTFKNVVILPHNNRLIFYLIIKLHPKHNIQYDNLFEVLTTMKNVLMKNNIQSIALPRFGKEERLFWPKVRAMIRFIFRNSNIKLTIYHHTQVHPKPEYIHVILEENHSLPHSGHFGF